MSSLAPESITPTTSTALPSQTSSSAPAKSITPLLPVSSVWASPDLALRRFIAAWDEVSVNAPKGHPMPILPLENLIDRVLPHEATLNLKLQIHHVGVHTSSQDMCAMLQSSMLSGRQAKALTLTDSGIPTQKNIFFGLGEPPFRNIVPAYRRTHMPFWFEVGYIPPTHPGRVLEGQIRLHVDFIISHASEEAFNSWFEQMCESRPWQCSLLGLPSPLPCYQIKSADDSCRFHFRTSDRDISPLVWAESIAL